MIFVYISRTNILQNKLFHTNLAGFSITNLRNYSQEIIKYSVFFITFVKVIQKKNVKYQLKFKIQYWKQNKYD